MDPAKSKSSISDTDGPIEAQPLQGTPWLGSNTARGNLVENTAAQTLEGGIRALARDSRPVGAEPRDDNTVVIAAEPWNDHPVSDAAEPRDNSRPFNGTAEPAVEACDEVVVAGATAIADIEKLMGELLVARDYLQAEGERVRQMTGRYAHLAQTASASARTIADSIGKWHNREPEVAMRLGRAPSLSPIDDGEM